MNEIRNELLGILSYFRSGDQFDLERVLERFEYDIKDQLKEIENKKQELENNLKTLEYVKEKMKEE